MPDSNKRSDVEKKRPVVERKYQLIYDEYVNILRMEYFDEK